MAQNDPRVQHILSAALKAFSRFGFRKTSMLDIAEAAGISRAALYLHFKNKEDVFRSGSAKLHGEVMTQVEAAIAEEGAVMKRLEAALTTFIVGLMTPIDSSEYGQDLFAANMALAADITEAAKKRLHALMIETLENADARGEIKLSAVDTEAQDLADMIVAAVEGFKHTEPHTTGKLAARIELFMRLLKAALQAERQV